MTGKPDASRYYVAATGFVSSVVGDPRTGQQFIAHKGMKLRGDHPAVIAHPDLWIDVREDPETAALAALIAENLRRPQTHSVPQDPPATPDEARADAATYGSTALTRNDILSARRQWQIDGPPPAHKRAGVSEATYIRHRHKHGLVPWPIDYRDRRRS